MKNLETLHNEYAAGKINFNEYAKEISNITKNDAIRLSNALYRLNKINYKK